MFVLVILAVCIVLVTQILRNDTQQDGKGIVLGIFLGTIFWDLVYIIWKYGG